MKELLNRSSQFHQDAASPKPKPEEGDTLVRAIIQHIECVDNDSIHQAKVKLAAASSIIISDKYKNRTMQISPVMSGL